jgi:hypothetical protein
LRADTLDTPAALTLASLARAELPDVDIVADLTYSANTSLTEMRLQFDRFALLNPDIFVGGGSSADGNTFVQSILYDSRNHFKPKLLFFYFSASLPSFLMQNQWKSLYAVSNTGWSDLYPYNDTFFGNSTALAGRNFRFKFTDAMGTEPQFSSAFSFVGSLVLMVSILAYSSWGASSC